ncbi:MAG: mycothiol system anti-sigma-R factor [Ruaniaceae bacterium]|nr:mycothiol system anti-sigma-R factor [Ruaniaceae bacterium]
MTDDCSCNDLIARLFAYLDSELDSAENARMKLHLEHCPHCTEEEEAERHVRELLRRCCIEQAPESLRIRVLGQITVMRQSITVYRTSDGTA